MAGPSSIDKLVLEARCHKLLLFILLSPCLLNAQHPGDVTFLKVQNEKRIDIYVGKAIFTSFLYPDSLEKPVLFPIYDADNVLVTRGFPVNPRPGEPTDHPHHIGLWFSYENVNGLDFWNNSYAIPEEKKYLYGWIKTDSILSMTNGRTGVLRYHANWVNRQNQVLIEETTRYEFSGTGHQRIIDRITDLSAVTDILFTDAKDGLLGLRLTRELQIPIKNDQHFGDNKGNVTIVKKDTLATGNYLTNEGKQGDSAWGTRAIWCKVYGKIGNDSISITIFDHTGNPYYPTFWHARGYGLFAANPLGEKIFTNGKSSLNLKLRKGSAVRFRYRILIQDGIRTPSGNELNQIAADYERSISP
jgi:hypothetical protein